ncbi:glycoside hydrolase family 16 protein [Jiulongibacter sp. NS-SX5]|uniref:glycoside hydrolase family 16 protein n=1 Tax=Jiulongibacter sp. NS-SX5 TaxID=3463854 RepID=UPI004058FDBF
MKIKMLTSSLLLVLAMACTETETPCVKKVWYADLDNDGKGDPNNSFEACEAPAGYVANADDDNDKGDVKIIPETGATSPEAYDGMTLIWQDEFSGTELDESFWNYEIGNNGGWGNNELQNYSRENTEVTDGHLIITAKRENGSYTSSRLTTEGKFDFKYGRVDIRAALPKDQGIWPALWMLGANFRDVGWPKCGEIDIMEMVGGIADGRDNTIHGTVHWDNAGSYASYGGSYTKPSGIFNGQFHVFSIVWDENEIRWLIDDEQYHVIDTTPAGLSEFQENYFFIFNVAVGGNWPGSPDGTTQFPQRMVVDYIRVFQ